MLDISEVNLDPVTAAAGKEAQKVCRHHMHICIFVCREHGFNNGYKPFIFANKQSPSYKSLDKTLQIKGCNTHTCSSWCTILVSRRNLVDKRHFYQ